MIFFRPRFLAFLVVCKAIKHDILYANGQGHFKEKESRAARFLVDKYVNLSSREPSDFLQYLQKSIQLTVEGAQVHDNKCIVKVSSTNQVAVDRLWSEYICGNLREITRCTLIAEEDLTLEVKIDAEEYKHCCMSFHAKSKC